MAVTASALITRHKSYQKYFCVFEYMNNKITRYFSSSSNQKRCSSTSSPELKIAGTKRSRTDEIEEFVEVGKNSMRKLKTILRVLFNSKNLTIKEDIDKTNVKLHLLQDEDFEIRKELQTLQEINKRLQKEYISQINKRSSLIFYGLNINMIV